MGVRKSRTIYYLRDQRELEEDLERALNSSEEENFRRYCQVINAQLALTGLDPDRSNKRIYYIE